ncbi:MAG: flagellar hook assembly protein FlgD [Burkholderiaceae bacterium]
MAATSTGAAAATSNYTLPSNIKTTTQYKQEQENAVINGKGDQMGQTAFLTLFTTQLKNQNPLDPMDNTAFVSQLAQFSQLEATTKMSGSMESLVKSLSTSQISGASALIGKTVGITDGKAVYDGAPVNGFVTLPTDVDSLTLKVYNSSGQLVRTGQVGAQKKGDFGFAWDGKDDSGNAVANGAYRIEASATRFGKANKAAITTMAYVRSVNTDQVTGDMKLEFNDGSQRSVSEIKRIGIQ